ncbi:MAG: hypothetical protein NT045_02620 [Candidatus Aureabacteria bacterium]|nr:hypothetical protein [Candidatus Auribacterota bacterium]
MRFLPIWISAIMVCVLAGPSGARAAEAIDPGQIVVNPKGFVGKEVTITVRFGKIEARRLGWESEANLGQGKKIKFIVAPLKEIACYADTTKDNQEEIGSLARGQELVLTGRIRKYKATAKVKGEERTIHRTVKGMEIYAFIVSRIESVGDAPQGLMPGMKMRRGVAPQRKLQ